ncbi:MAG: PAS domain S-box protein, partial [Caldilineaceae bacterium]|nr:PAS domain S-box protein [Caldilineaceae bacterium]
ISERRRWEEALAERESMLRTLGDNLPNGFLYQLVTGPHGPERYTHVSAGVERVTGIHPNTLLRDPTALLAQLPAEDVERFARLTSQAMTTGATLDIQFQRRVRSGELRWSHLRAAHRPPLPDGRMIWDGLVLDITDLKQAEQALNESNRRYRAIFETANAGIALTDGDGTILEVNEAFAQMLGYRPDDLVGVHFLTITHPDERANEMQHVQRARTEDGGALRPWFEKRYLHRDGSTVWVRLAVQLLRNDTGQPWLMTAVVQNITDVKQLETQLRQAQKMEAIGRLAGGLAHDFNNLLTVINGYSDLLVRQMHPADPMRPRVEQIRAAGERAAGLTRQLLAFGRRQVIAPSVFDLNVLVADLEKMLSRLVGEHIHVSAVLSPAPGPIKADPSQMEQVLLNLVANARDAMPEGGRLTITTANVQLSSNDINRYPSLAAGLYVMLTVADTGHGMDAETQAHIFEPFFTTKGAGKGTGLGLATTYGIIQQNGGVIDLYSEVGRGAIFKVLLPATDEQLPQPPPATNGDRAQAANAETILLVEDDDQIRDLACAALTANGYTVLPAANGQAALRVVAEHAGPIDLLVSDVVMPGMNGRQLSDRLLAMRPDLKVLFVSGYPAAELAPRGILAPGITLLPKPYTPDILQAKVREMLDQ